MTEGQRLFLEKSKIDLGGIKGRGHASAIIDLIISRSKLRLATPRQLQFLRQMGHPSPETATFDQASAFLNARWGKKRETQPEFI